MKITVPPDIERVISARASELGTSPEVVILDSLRERFCPPGKDEDDTDHTPLDETLADFLDGYVGVLHSHEQALGGGSMSEEAGKKFTEALLKKRQAGRL